MGRIKGRTANKLFEEFPHEPVNGRRLEVVVDQGAEVQPQVLVSGRKGQGRDQRNFVALFGPVLEDGGLAFGRQSSTYERGQQDPALVDEYQMGT